MVIMKGPKAYFAKCPGCGARVYLPYQWTADMGLTSAQCQARGIVLLTVVTKRIVPKR
jgi:hypothetical protein